MQLWAQLGMSETHWAEARPAVAAMRRAEYFMLTEVEAMVIHTGEGIEMLWMSDDGGAWQRMDQQRTSVDKGRREKGPGLGAERSWAFYPD